MPRGNNTLVELYTNILSGEKPLGETLQMRIYQYAKSNKNNSLAAALAKRADTSDEIDQKLSIWAAAPVQAAWFSRPGRSMVEVANKLKKEKRITVIETGAQIPGLDPVVYQAFVEHDSPKILSRLLENESVPETIKVKAASKMAPTYKELSYMRQNEFLNSLAKCQPSVWRGFLGSSPELSRIRSLINTIEDVDPETASLVYAVCLKNLKPIAAQDEKFKVPAGHKVNKYHWRSELFEHLKPIEEVAPILESLAGAKPDDEELRKEMEDVLLNLWKQLSKKSKTHGEWVVDLLDNALMVVGHVNSKHLARLTAVHDVKSSEKLSALIDSWTGSDERIVPVVGQACLLSEHANVQTTLKLCETLHWSGRDVPMFLREHASKLRIEVLAAALVGSYMTSDEDIERASTGRDPKEVWAAVASVKFSNMEIGYYSYHNLFESKYIDVSILPKLPLAVLTQDDLPKVLVEALGEYLEQNLLDQASWDGFEVLAKSHLGSLEQVVKAGRLATKRGGAKPSTSNEGQ
jgi:hypothetical protein